MDQSQPSFLSDRHTWRSFRGWGWFALIRFTADLKIKPASTHAILLDILNLREFAFGRI